MQRRKRSQPRSPTPLLGSPPAPDRSPGLSPNEHVRALIELLRARGGAGPDLGRRWLAALLLVPQDEREEVVAAVESRLVETYANGSDAASPGLPTPRPPAEGDRRELRVSGPAVQRDGYVERTETTYEVVTRPAATEAKRGVKRSG